MKMIWIHRIMSKLNWQFIVSSPHNPMMNLPDCCCFHHHTKGIFNSLFNDFSLHRHALDAKLRAKWSFSRFLPKTSSSSSRWRFKCDPYLTMMFHWIKSKLIGKNYVVSIDYLLNNKEMRGEWQKVKLKELWKSH